MIRNVFFWQLLVVGGLLSGCANANAQAGGDAISAKCIAEVKQVEEEIAAVRTCQTTSDCSRIVFGCPWGCGTPANTALAERVKEHIKKHHEDGCPECVYRCSAPTGEVVCETGQCTEARKAESVK